MGFSNKMPRYRALSPKDYAYSILLRGAIGVHPSVRFDLKGYAPDWTSHLLPGLPLASIERDLAAGAGQELHGKFLASHSSSALAVNCFGPWRDNTANLAIASHSNFRTLRFEEKFRTNLGTTPPHLDVFLDAEIPMAIESKCTEWIKSKPALFSPTYDRLPPQIKSTPWFATMLQLRLDPKLYCHLDAAQLIKHAFGLLHHYGTRPVTLLYLYWQPQAADSWPQTTRHREEIADFTTRVSPSTLRFESMTYPQLWAQWRASSPPAHLPYLQSRYLLT